MINLYRKKGYGEDILICKDDLGDNEKNIGNLLATADKGIYLIESKDILTLIR